MEGWESPPESLGDRGGDKRDSEQRLKRTAQRSAQGGPEVPAVCREGMRGLGLRAMGPGPRAETWHSALGTSSVCPSHEPRLHRETSSSGQGGSLAWAKCAHSLRSLTQCYTEASQGSPRWGGGALMLAGVTKVTPGTISRDS